MRIHGVHGSYEFEDISFASGGAALLFRGVGVHSGLVYKRYHEPMLEPEQCQKLLHVVAVGRKVFNDSSVTIGSSPESSVCWPIDVEHGAAGTIVGTVMPVIPDTFFRNAGKARTLSYLIMARTNPPGAPTRVSVLIRVAEIFAWLAANHLAHGDFSDANIVWQETPVPGAVLIDADGLQPADQIAAKGMKTPHWIDPRVVTGSVPAHDQYSDWYALALAMYRGLLLGPGNLDRQPDGSWPKPSHIPASFPSGLNALLQRTLSSPVDENSRATPAEWVAALRQAFVLNDTAFNAPALRELDRAADQNRPQVTAQFRPLPPLPPPTRAATSPPQRTVARTAPNAPPLPMLPVSQPRSTTAATTGKILAGTGVVAAAIVITALLANSSQTPTPSTTSVAGLSTYVPSYVPSYTVPSSTYTWTATTSSPAAPTFEADPSTALNQQVQSDATAVEALVGQWVPQLSSKTVGTKDNGITYDNAAILAHYRTLKDQFPSALLLSSSSYSTFKSKGYWVVVLPEGYRTGAEANARCASAGLDANNCFAKLISHTAGPQGATLNR